MEFLDGVTLKHRITHRPLEMGLLLTIAIEIADGAACPLIAADEQHYVFGYTRNLSDLFLVEHLK